MALVLLTVVSTAAGAQDHTAEATIKALMAAQFDRPEQRLMVNPVVVEGDHAIAGWVQGDMGGRALLRRQCPLSGAKRTCLFALHMSAYDP
jgi:hypothetical protein